jgi:hypothetical protein
MQSWSGFCPASALDGWSRWPASVALRRKASVDQVHTVSVTLEGTSVDVDVDEMLLTLRSALAHFRLQLAHDLQGRTVLVLTLETTDLWLAVLMAMNAVAATGYPAVAVQAEPATSAEAGPAG